MNFEWEEICKSFNGNGGFITYRAKVFGGWIVKNMCWDDSLRVQSESSVFVPDSNHDW